MCKQKTRIKINKKVVNANKNSGIVIFYFIIEFFCRSQNHEWIQDLPDSELEPEPLPPQPLQADSPNPESHSHANSTDTIDSAPEEFEAAEADLVEAEAARVESSSKDPKGKKMKLKTVLSWNISWLKYELSDDGIWVTKVWCGICREFGSSASVLNPGQSQCCRDRDAYVDGTTNVKKDTVNTHQTSTIHCRAVAAKNAKNDPTSSDLGKHFTKIDDGTFDHMCKLFDWAYVVAKKELSFKMFPTLVETEIKHGGDLGKRYINEVQCRNFIMSIAANLVDDMHLLFDQEPFYCSLLFDGSSDKTLKEKEAISIKILDRTDGRVKTLSVG